MRYIKIFEEFINSINEDINDMDAWFELYKDLTYEIFNYIGDQKKIKFDVINKSQYHTALKEFTKYGEFMGRFPVKYIYNWKELVLESIAKLDILNSINGHSSSFPYEEFYDMFDNAEQWEYENEKFKDVNQLEIKFPDFKNVKNYIGGEYTHWCKDKFEETGDNDYNNKYDWGDLLLNS